MRDIRNLFESGEEDFCKPVRIGNAFSNNCIEYESNSYKNKILSVEEYLVKIKPYLKDIINNLRISCAWKI